MTTYEREVLKTLRVFGPCSNAEVARRLGEPMDRTYRAIQRLTRDVAAVVNLFSYVATDVLALRYAEDPVGQSDYYIDQLAPKAGIVIAGWGSIAKMPSMLRGRADEVRMRFAAKGWPLACLGLNGDGSPAHPLFLDAKRELMPYRLRVAEVEL